MRVCPKPSPVALSLLLAGWIQLPVLAQTAPAPGARAESEKKEATQETKTTKLEAIVVTSSKRRELAHRLPYNVTAIGEQALRDEGITDLKKLIQASPAIEAPPNSARFTDSVTVRGLNVSSVSANNIEWFARSTLSTYLDDTPLPMVGIRIKDIARVETLLGPQGTLYGGGALGGTVRYITNKPKLGAFEGRINAGLSQVKGGALSSDTDLMLNVPLGEDVALRVSLANLDDGGFTDRFAGKPPTLTSSITAKPDAGQVLYENDDWYKAKTARASLLWQATPDLELRLTHTWQDGTAHGTSGAQLNPASGSPARYLAAPTWDQQTVLSPYPEFTDRKISLTSFDLDWRLAGIGRLHSSTATYQDTRVGQADYLATGSFFYGDLGYSRYRLGSSSWSGNTAFITYDNRNKGWTHETRVVSDPGVFSWIAGVYFSDQEKSNQFSEWLPTLPTRSTRAGEGYMENLGSQYKESALFGELSWAGIERLTLTAGARLFAYEDQASTQVEDYAFDLVTGQIKNTEKESGKSYFKLNASYQFTDDLLGYATFSQGFRRGGANGFRGVGNKEVNPSVRGYASDSTDNLEIGAKGYLLDRQLYVQANAYRILWKDPQTYFSQDIDGFPVWGTTNGPDARSEGFEFQARWKPVSSIELGMASTYTRGEWDDTKEVCLYANNSECRTYTKGGKLGGSAPWKHTLRASWRGEWAGHAISASLGARYVGVKASDRGDHPDDKPFEYKSYTTYRGSVGLSQGNWNLSLWVDNLTNERELVSFQGTSAVASRVGLRAVYLTPRTVGLNLGWRF
ncbi:TonB-dependent receptor [Inhella gelatinilytica]|uniref:TonB-dependent receptor n=1 Tax=Inhella gelatinilytica TaxID=2795030 RepID=A0A931NDH5_9BURK|nr:TonB-dependent receptor [Inhella gelatinilytica]MBH9552604.1 TonB-dependent receptor [Inhella gelatinilytica]